MRFVLTLCLSALLVIGTGCGSSESPPAARSVTDALGRPVSVDSSVERVVSLAPNLTELAYAAGGGDRLVAVTTADDYPPAVDTLDRLSALPVDFEAVTAQRPDLVLATDQVNPPGDTDTFEALDVPIYFFSFSSLDDVFDGLRTMGSLLGTEAAARDSVRALQRRLSCLRVRTDSIPLPERPRVLVLIGDQALYSFGAGSYIHTLVEAAGGRSITDSLDTEAPTLSEEFVLTEQPDVIVGAWGSSYNPDTLLAHHPTWDVVPAIRNGRVYSLPPDLLLRPGPRLVTGAARMATRLHPTLAPASTSCPRDTVTRTASSTTVSSAP
ncbi:MAG: ABC transporter substrate-binding protein [Bacteroidetes bacterium SW_9_63_38]|nr:MAG: ABC transporter substrate-binding protein [Bacteroidetes bacterium SW_9_63_38]